MSLKEGGLPLPEHTIYSTAQNIAVSPKVLDIIPVGNFNCGHASFWLRFRICLVTPKSKIETAMTVTAWMMTKLALVPKETFMPLH